jgi:SAM-dependent methyltransferase
MQVFIIRLVRCPNRNTPTNFAEDLLNQGQSTLVDFDEYVSNLTNAHASAYFELDQQREATYMRDHAYHFKRILKSMPRSDRPLTILDIGTTPFTLYLKKEFAGYHVFTLDRSDLLKARCLEAGVEFRSCDLDLASIPFEGEFFDVVVFTEVLEHIFCPPSIILGEVKRILKPSGLLILSVPNIASLLNRVKLAFGFSPLEDADHQMNRHWVHGHGHVHEFVRKEIVQLCAEAGFSLVDTDMLAESPMSAFTGSRGFNVKRFVYFGILSLFPSLRFEIFLECRK